MRLNRHEADHCVIALQHILQNDAGLTSDMRSRIERTLKNLCIRIKSFDTDRNIRMKKNSHKNDNDNEPLGIGA